MLNYGSKDAFCARDVVTACADDGFTDSQSQGLECGLGTVIASLTVSRTWGMDLPVVVIFATEDIDMQRNAGSIGKGVEDMRDHFRRQISYFLSLEAELRDAVGSGANVDDGPG